MYSTCTAHVEHIYHNYLSCFLLKISTSLNCMTFSTPQSMKCYFQKNQFLSYCTYPLHFLLCTKQVTSEIRRQ